MGNNPRVSAVCARRNRRNVGARDAHVAELGIAQGSELFASSRHPARLGDGLDKRSERALDGPAGPPEDRRIAVNLDRRLPAKLPIAPIPGLNSAHPPAPLPDARSLQNIYVIYIFWSPTVNPFGTTLTPM